MSVLAQCMRARTYVFKYVSVYLALQSTGITIHKMSVHTLIYILMLHAIVILE